MWLQAPFRNESMHVIITPQEIITSWISFDKQHPILKAYGTTQVAPIYQDNPLDNPQAISKIIKAFQKTHALEDSFISLALNAGPLTQKIIYCTSACPRISEYAHHIPRGHASGLQYLFAHEGSWAFHLSTMAPDLLMRYQLYFHKEELKLARIVTAHTPLYHCYKAIAGSSFRQSQLALDLARTEYALEKLITQEQLINHITLEAPVPEDHTTHIAISTGLAHLYKENQQ